MSDQSIFLAALDISDPAERSAYLATACAGNDPLRKEVEALLSAHERPGAFLDEPAVAQMSAPGAGETRTVIPGELDFAETQAPESAGGASDNDVLAFLRPPARADSLGRLDHYEVFEVLGRGGFGTVLRAFDDRLHRVVAIKVMAPQLAASGAARARFLREGRSAAAVRDEHVVNVHAVSGDSEPIPYLVMEFVAGQTLQQKLDKSGPLSVAEVLRIGGQIARGLSAAHATGLIHRDIKPANILLENGVERVKITDFGLARAADDASISQSGVIAGTPMYMAPEQARGDAIDHRADLFSLGSVLYAMCTGRPPFRADTTLAVLKRVCEDDPRPIREVNRAVPQWLADVVAKLHAKNPDDRFQSAKEVADLLAQYLTELQMHGTVAPQIAARPAKARRAPRALLWRWKWAVAVGFVLALLAGAVWLWEYTSLGSVRVRSSQDGVAYLYARDGRRELPPDHPYPLRPGSYTLTYMKYGEEVYRQEVVVGRGEHQQIEIPEEGTLRFELADPATEIILMDVPWTAAPGADPRVRERRVPIGRHWYTVRTPGAAASSGATVVRGDVPSVIRIPAPDKDDWVQLFNGKDLTEWHLNERTPGRWRVESGVLVGSAGEGFLSSAKAYDNFHLRVQAKVNAAGNSGVSFGRRYQIEIRHDPLCPTGSLLEFEPGQKPSIARFPHAAPAPDQWFELEIKVEGESVAVRIDGGPWHTMRVARDDRLGPLELESLNADTVVHFKKIEIKELPPVGLLPETASQALPALAGNWKGEFTQKTVNGKPAPLKLDCNIAVDWVADKRFLRQRIQHGATGDLQVMTLDPETRLFRSWFFNAHGAALGPSVGRWDAATRTITWTNIAEADTVGMKNLRFVDANTVTWDILFRDKAGAVLYEGSGKMTRTAEKVEIKEELSPGPLPAEMSVLDRLVGDWETSGTLKVAGNPAEEKFTTRVRSRKVLGGRLIVSHETGLPGHGDAYWLATFDARMKEYRFWMFSAEGDVMELGGAWDEKAQTMTWHRGGPDSGRNTATWHWPDPNTREWAMTTRDASGKPALDVRAVSTRRTP
jgi:hypothetical protein